MYEFHGWATVRDSAGSDDLNPDPAPSTVDKVQELAREANGPNHVVDARYANGEFHVWMAGSHNHTDQRVLQSFERIAKLAPGSYGVLYVLDDEHPTQANTWTRFVMRRGSVTMEIDESLSPHIGVVEDDTNGP